MARNLAVGESVYAPRNRLGLSVDSPSAFYRTSVAAVSGRSVRVNLPDGSISELIGSWAVHRMIGILIFRIGDFETEENLLDPLAKSVLHFSRLLLSPNEVLMREVRSPSEFSAFWKNDRAVCSHVVIIGHGRKTGIRFGEDDWVSASDWSAIIPLGNRGPKNFVSLCCNTGYKSFGSDFSLLDACRTLIAPFHDVHGGIGSQFVQTYLATQLLEGYKSAVAFKRARSAVPGSTSFRLWDRGKLKAGPS